MDDVPDDDAGDPAAAAATAALRSAAEDPEAERVAAALLALDPDGSRFAAALRRTFDMLLDGQHTGRFRWDQLHKTEKTHAGTLVEINLQREFAFADGERMDYRISGIDVDCKYSQRIGAWMIPPEAHRELLLVVWANDKQSRWCAGLVRAVPELLNTGSNRDGKRTLSIPGRGAVRWLFQDAPLQENTLLRLPDTDIEAIFAGRSGQARVDELFRRAQGRRISRTVVATVAQQDDYMKRVRSNGGSRSRLRAEGVVILGQYSSHQQIATYLGLPEPQAGESVSIRLAALRLDHGDAPRIELGGRHWTVAGPRDPAEQAPELPRI